MTVTDYNSAVQLRSSQFFSYGHLRHFLKFDKLQITNIIPY